MKFTCAILSIAAVSAHKLHYDVDAEPLFNIAVHSFDKSKMVSCRDGDTATVHYTGKLASNGKMFDTSILRQDPEPFRFVLG